ncbi:MAG: hypothetical protein DGJ47_000195 [Rickettsiaceae bacterium]
MQVYEVKDLKSAKDFLSTHQGAIILTNPQGSSRYYGMRVIDCIMKILQKEFPHKIDNIVINAYDDYAAFITARKLGYKNIKYFNRTA